MVLARLREHRQIADLAQTGDLMEGFPADHALAEALQRVLLPTNLPEIDGWALATLYEPAGDHVLVGGDFYDWFVMPSGRVLFFIGDVSGKGPLAGALGMSVRKALKGMVWANEDLLACLPLLERALAEEFAEAFTTLCLLELTPGSGTLNLVLAGHPPPWLRCGGIFSEVVAPANSVLGPGLLEGWRSVKLELEPGDMLVLFTDGLAEARLPDGSLFGDGPWERFLTSLPPHLASYETVLQADAHLRRIARHLPDDVLIGVLTYSDPSVGDQPTRAPATWTAETLAIRLTPHSNSAGDGRRFVLQACRRWDLDDDAQFAAETITSELVTNAILHARTDLELKVSRDPRHLRVAVSDESPSLPVLPGPTTPSTADAAEDPLSDPLALYLDLDHGRGLRLIELLGARLEVEAALRGKTVSAILPLSEHTADEPPPLLPVL